ncbi:MAG: glycosyltransferase family 4 protein [Spirochaetaceae bacterium]|jgi:glycosyltransferase involved in cell wall biosynthesis|nr:glycosyltransferase family 4 protein [Spirochaetaceae bacterium]
MKIGIDTFACGSGASGVGAYVTQLLRRIPPSGDHYELFGYELDRYSWSEAAPALEYTARCRISGRTANSLWHQFRYPEFSRSRGYAVCFFPAAHRCLPRRSPVPAVGTVHDMAAYWGGRRDREHLGAVIRMILPNALRNLDRIIAVSRWVKQELVELAGVKENRIEVIHNGIDPDAWYPRKSTDESAVLIQPFSFRRPYILYAARLEHPVKNHVNLIRAFEIFRERTKHPHRLVLAGGDDRGAGRIRDAAAHSPLRNDIFFTGVFPVKNLPELYAGANMVVVPSRYEGFGLGALEAMASGVPVACARSASLPEAAEDAALYFDPLDVEDMADRMVTLSSNRDLARELRGRGLERVKAFSWDRAVERTLAIIRESAG